MPHDSVSRREFLHNMAAGSTGAALGSALAGTSAAAATPVDAGGEPPLPSTVESYPIAQPGKGVDRLKIVTMGKLPDPYPERIRSFSSGIELKSELSEEAFRRELADAHALYGIQRVKVDPSLDSLMVEYDATRLRPAEVEAALSGAGIPVEAA